MQGLLLPVAAQTPGRGEVQQRQAAPGLQHAAKGCHLAAAVADQRGIGREERLDLRQIAAPRSLGKAA